MKQAAALVMAFGSFLVSPGGSTFYRFVTFEGEIVRLRKLSKLEHPCSA